MSWAVFGMTLLCSWIAIFGDILIKLACQPHFASRLVSYYVFLAALLYGSTAPVWFWLLKRAKMSVLIGCLYPVMTTVFITLVDVYVFKEKLNWREGLGMTLGLISVVLLMKE